MEWIHPVADQTSGSRAFLVSPPCVHNPRPGSKSSIRDGSRRDRSPSPIALGLNQKLPIMGSGEEGACSLDPAGPCPSPVSADKCEQVCGCPSFSLHRSQRSSVKGKTRRERGRERGEGEEWSGREEVGGLASKTKGREPQTHI